MGLLKLVDYQVTMSYTWDTVEYKCIGWNKSIVWYDSYVTFITLIVILKYFYFTFLDKTNAFNHEYVYN